MLKADQVEETVDLECTTHVGVAHRVFELQKAVGIAPKVGNGDSGGHAGTGNAISRSVSVAIRTLLHDARLVLLNFDGPGSLESLRGWTACDRWMPDVMVCGSCRE
jgi:hypothetical protein